MKEEYKFEGFKNLSETKKMPMIKLSTLGFEQMDFKAGKEEEFSHQDSAICRIELYQQNARFEVVLKEEKWKEGDTKPGESDTILTEIGRATPHVIAINVRGEYERGQLAQGLRFMADVLEDYLDRSDDEICLDCGSRKYKIIYEDVIL